MLVCDNVLLQEPALLARLKLFLSCVQKPPSAAISASPVTLLTLLLMMFWKHTPALTPALVRVQISSFHNGFISVFAPSALQSAVSLFYDVFQVILAQGSKRATDFPTMWYQSVAFYVNEMFLCSFVFPGFVFLPSSWNFHVSGLNWVNQLKFWVACNGGATLIAFYLAHRQIPTALC